MKNKIRFPDAARLLAALALFTILSQAASALINPIDEEAAAAYFREMAGKNYVRIINEKIDSLRNINSIIIENPVVYDPAIQSVMGFFVSVLQPLYITAIIVAGIYLMFFSGNPSGRAKAKASLWIAIIGIALITVAPNILSLFFGASKAITLLVLARSPVDTEQPFVQATDYMMEKATHIMDYKGSEGFTTGDERAGTVFLLVPYLMLETIFFALKLRFYIVAILAIILPLTITLYAFMPTRGIGRLLAEQTILWTFAQAAMAAVLIVIAIGMSLTSSITSFEVTPALRFVMEFAGLLMLMLSPFAFVKLFRGFLA